MRDPNGRSSYEKFIQEIHPRRPRWYENCYAKFLNSNSGGYDKDKAELFRKLDGRVSTVLEIGIGTGTNFEYLSGITELKIIGVDPNRSMEKHAIKSLAAAGIGSDQFKFIHGVSEKIPVESASIDLVVSTLVLCSVRDIQSTLREVVRVLKPGGFFLFMEHVTAQEGSWLRFFQNMVNPLQILVFDGCHLNRNILFFIQGAGFSSINSRSVCISSKCPLVSPHVLGVARK